ncbi:MAG TPA: DUF4410 domain-containing protein [Desulfuromonadaceae bacterium]
MPNHVSGIRGAVISLVVLALSATFPAFASGGEIGKKITGEVKVKSRTDESRQPTSAPKVIYIQDFDLGYDTAKQDAEGPGRRILGRLRQSRQSGAEQKAKKLVGIMTGSLVKWFSEKGIVARQPIPGPPLPDSGWLIRGVFTEVDQGKRIVRATIGFGAGSTKMEVYVRISNLADDPDAPFIIFGTEKEPNKVPGAIVTMNPYVAAAKFVMQKNASEKDVKKTAAQIVETVMNYVKTLDKQRDKPEP